MKKADLKKKKLGEVLLEAKILSKGQLEEALTLQRKTRRRLGKLLIELGYVDEDELAQTLSVQLKVPTVNMESIDPDEDALSKVSEEQAREKVIMPVKLNDKNLTIAMASPLDWMTIQEIEFATNTRVTVNIATESSIMKAIDRAYGQERPIEDINAGLPEAPEVDISKIAVEGMGSDLDSLYRAAEHTPVVQMFSKMLADALRANATAIHLEPREKFVQVRMRIDGSLRNTLRYPHRAHEAIAARAKSLTRLDLLNRTMPQEGTNRVGLGGREVNISVNTLPSINGESILISIIEKARPIVPTAKLGLSPQTYKFISSTLHKGQGILLLGGLAGSGRHTTMYSLLQLLESEAVSIVAVGTASGYSLPGAKEIQTNDAAGFGLAIALRSALKHDPDIIATGEIKDKASAEEIARAAFSGKLVISIIESPDAVSAITKLASFGLSPHTIRSTLSGILAQKLLKGICQSCRQPLEPETMTFIKTLPPLEMAYTGTGCKKCAGTGSKGRVAVFEFIGINATMMNSINRDMDESSLAKGALSSEFTTLFDDAWAKTASGYITADEALTLRKMT